jgi:allantoinase
VSNPSCDLAVRGRAVTPSGVLPATVRMRGGVIDAVLPASADGRDVAGADQVLDVGNSYVLPGAVDAHVHCLSSPGEGIDAATRSALAGGVTTIVEMPYDSGAPVNSAERFAAKRDAVESQAHTDVALLATVTPVGGAETVAGLVAAGAAGFKLSLFDTDHERFPRIPDHELLAVLEAIARAGSIACFHAENDEVIKPLIDLMRQQGRTNPADHAASRPPVSETEAVLKAAEFAHATSCRVHFCHLSLARSVDLVAWFAAGGLDASVETCSHYLTFTEDAIEEFGSRLKINPPLRPARDTEALWNGLASRSVQVVASDHAPWPLSDKQHANVFDNHSGVPGVQTLVPLVLGQGLARGIGIEALVSALSTYPARRFGLAGKGAVAPGFDADLIVFDPEGTTVIDEAALRSNAGWSPYHGIRLTGQLTHVIARGEVFVGGESASKPGRGRVLLPGGHS